jgi:hypothetical protein
MGIGGGMVASAQGTLLVHENVMMPEMNGIEAAIEIGKLRHRM